MKRKDLIRMYLNAETTCEQERELADSFTAVPPADEEEMAVYRMMQAVSPIRLPELPEAGHEFDRMARPATARSFYTWGLSLSGVAAAILALFLITGKPENSVIPATPPNDNSKLIQQLALISKIIPPENGRLEFRPAGDGFVMTAYFSDGRTASYILAPLDSARSFKLISLNH